MLRGDDVLKQKKKMYTERMYLHGGERITMNRGGWEGHTISLYNYLVYRGGGLLGI